MRRLPTPAPGSSCRCAWSLVSVKLQPGPSHVATVSATTNWSDTGVFEAAGLLASSLCGPGVSIDRFGNVATPATVFGGAADQRATRRSQIPG